jgi:hypothetical protein
VGQWVEQEGLYIILTCRDYKGTSLASAKNRDIIMASHLWILCLSFLFLASGAMSATPRKAIDVPFGRNYVPTWAFDHIKYYNGGSEIQLTLDKSTGKRAEHNKSNHRSSLKSHH